MKKRFMVVFILIASIWSLSACASNQKDTRKDDDFLIYLKKIAKENNGWIPTQTKKYNKEKLLFDQIKWEDFEIKDEEIVFAGTNGSEWSFDLIKEHSDDVIAKTDNIDKGKRMTFKELENSEALLTNTITNEKGRSMYDLPISLGSSHIHDMFINKFTSNNTDWDLTVYMPCKEHNVKISDAFKNIDFCIIPKSYNENFNYRPLFALESYGDKFYTLVCPLEKAIPNNLAGSYIELLAKSLGRPTGLITAKKADYFNYYVWFMYWERKTYTVCQKVEEIKNGADWNLKFYTPVFIQQRAWNIIKEETVPKDRYSGYENIDL